VPTSPGLLLLTLAHAHRHAQGSCGGFNGISDSFTAALWGLDYTLQMVHSNFSGAMFHLDGQNVFYNVSLSISVFVSFPSFPSPHYSFLAR
jgi:hypothetical protein